MKTRITDLLPMTTVLVVAALLLPACQTPEQLQASAEYTAGSDFAMTRLDANSDALQGLTDFKNKLPDIILGKVSAFDMGVLNAELQPIIAAGKAGGKDAAAFRRIGNLISTFSHLNGQNPTTSQGIALAAVTSFANGMNDGINFWQGATSVAKTNLAVIASLSQTLAGLLFWPAMFLLALCTGIGAWLGKRKK